MKMPPILRGHRISGACTSNDPKVDPEGIASDQVDTMFGMRWFAVAGGAFSLGVAALIAAITTTPEGWREPAVWSLAGALLLVAAVCAVVGLTMGKRQKKKRNKKYNPDKTQATIAKPQRPALIEFGGNVKLSDSHIDNNTVIGDADLIRSKGDVELERSTISGNKAIRPRKPTPAE
jgi:hypothetical protein